MTKYSSTLSKGSDGETIGGIFCGRQVLDGIYAEEMTERRYVIRKRIEPTYAKRVGEVCGGAQYGGGYSYQATRPNGEHVSTEKTFVAAVKKLLN